MVYEGQPEKPPPIRDEDRAPFWEGLGDKISDRLSEFENEEVGGFICYELCAADVPSPVIPYLGMRCDTWWWWWK